MVEEFSRRNLMKLHEVENGEERAILVTVDMDNTGERSLDELERLAYTAGAIVIHRIIQRKQTIDSGTYVGRGKAKEIKYAAKELDADLIIFDDELSAAQIKNLEDIIGVRVIDRTALILDIFAKRANSKEGKLQVELAQLRYRLPRLTGMGLTLSRLGGGIGTRGPGETKLETDRRHIRQRIFEIEKELKTVKMRRDSLRERRKKIGYPTVALVGYTNAGKSTLMNLLTNSNILVEDKLFATLDPTSRKVVLKNGQEIILIDTVGFINKLPHDLVEAFKSTLEEVIFADLLLHVVDGSSPSFMAQMKTVEKVLDSMGVKKPIITVYNKIDKLESTTFLPRIKPYVFISAAKGIGIDELLIAIEENLPETIYQVTFLIPYEDMKVVSSIYDEGNILREHYGEKYIELEAEVDKITYMRYEKYRKTSQKYD